MKQITKSLNEIIDPQTAQVYKCIKTIITTEFSKILLVQDDELNQFACKVISKEKLQIKKFYDMFSQEIHITQRLNNKNILSSSKIIKDVNNYYILSDYCHLGTLTDLVQSRERLSEEEIQFIIYEILNGLHYLKKEKIIHRDLKPQNILLKHILPDDIETFDQLRVKIIDFGLSHQYMNEDEKLFSFCGSPIIVSPEMLISYINRQSTLNKQTDPSINAECSELVKQIIERQCNIRPKYKKYDPLESGYEYEIDLWALGIVMFYLMYKKFPFSASSISLLYQKQIRGDYIINTSKNPYLSQICIDFMENLLSPNRNDRMTLEQAFENDWISHGAMVKLTYLPSQATNKNFNIQSFQQENIEVLNYKETIQERIQMQRSGLIQKPINLPTIDISDALRGLGLLKIQMRPPRPITYKIPFSLQISVTSWLVKNYASIVVKSTQYILPNPIKWPPVLTKDELFNKLSFDEFIGTLNKQSLKCIKNYQIWRYGITRNASYEEELSGLPNIVFMGDKILATTHSEKYGDFYLFKDGTCSAKFFDDSILSLSPNELIVDVIDYPQSCFINQLADKHRQKRQVFRVKLKFFSKFFQDNKLKLVQWFKKELIEQLKQDEMHQNQLKLIKRQSMLFSPSTCEDIETSSDTPSYGTDSSLSQNPYDIVKQIQLPIELQTTLDLFLDDFMDLLYDDSSRIFHQSLATDDILKFSSQRRRTIQKGKTSNNNYSLNDDFPYILHLNNPKILSIILQDIIAVLVENSQADYGANAIISYIAASVDLNFLCLNFLKKPLFSVDKQIITNDMLLFRLTDGGFQADWNDSRKLIINQENIMFESAECEQLIYPIQYMQDSDFKFSFIQNLVFEIKEINKEYQI